MSEDREFITKERAIELIGKKDRVHTFVNPMGMLVGADWDWEDVVEALENAKEIEIGGEMCRRMKHPIVINDGDRFVFVEATNFGGGA